MELVYKKVTNTTYDLFWDQGWENHCRFHIYKGLGPPSNSKPYIKFDNKLTPTLLKNIIISKFLYGKDS